MKRMQKSEKVNKKDSIQAWQTNSPSKYEGGAGLFRRTTVAQVGSSSVGFQSDSESENDFGGGGGSDDNDGWGNFGSVSPTPPSEVPVLNHYNHPARMVTERASR